MNKLTVNIALLAITLALVCILVGIFYVPLIIWVSALPIRLAIIYILASLVKTWYPDQIDKCVLVPKSVVSLIQHV